MAISESDQTIQDLDFIAFVEQTADQTGHKPIEIERVDDQGN